MSDELIVGLSYLFALPVCWMIVKVSDRIKWGGKDEDEGL